MAELILPVPQPVQTDPNKLRWGIVSTIKGSTRQVAQFIAFHLDLGANRIHIHLDVPNPELAERLSHPKVRFTQCDDAYWKGKPNRARSTHQMRQVYNATRMYRISKLDWLAHIDLDEMIFAPAPMTDLLAAVDPNTAFVEMEPVEMLDSGTDPHHFKRPIEGAIKRLIYPLYGAHVQGGFISTQSPKIIARTGLEGVRLGIHALRYDGRVVRGGAKIDGLDLGHAHAPDYDTFQRHMAYRLEKGSYHDRKGRLNRLGHLIRTLMDDPEKDALRDFHREMCSASPERLDLLAAHDMLITRHLDLNAKVARYFGKLEG